MTPNSSPPAFEPLTAEHLLRRIAAGLPPRQTDVVVGSGGALLEAVAPPARSGLALRVKTWIVEGWLPKVKLTSYNSLLRSQERWVRAAQERDRLAAELVVVSAERDRLALELRQAHERADRGRRDQAELVAARDRLSGQLQECERALHRLKGEAQRG